MQLSDQQKKAVEYIGSPTLVVAGAGSGKTRTLTAKISYLINKQKYNPEKILAITFTNKAADEMKKRLVETTGMPSYSFPWVRTYHSACFKILKQHCTVLGYTNPIQIYSSHQQKKIITEIITSLNYDKKYLPAVQSNISKAKNYGNPEKYFEIKPKVSNIRLIEIYKQYKKKLKELNVVDFDDILLLTRDLLRDNDDLRKHYKDMFGFILVDEYQDSNNIQEELTRLFLKDGNLFCVGDDWQSVYGFRGSNVNHFLSFEKKYKNAKVFRLEQNFRSADEIVKIANNLIDYNKDKMSKTCFSQIKGGVVKTNSFYNESQEAEWVTKKAMSLYRQGIKFDQMAVIYRTKFCSLAFEKMFRYYKVPYQMMGDRGFFERKEIMDINSYITAAVFDTDDISFERIINIPKRGIGPAMLKKINGTRSGTMSLKDATRKVIKDRILSPKVHKDLSELLYLLDEIKDMSPDHAIKAVISKTGYMEYLKSTSQKDKMDFTSRKENIDELIYTASQKQTIVDYLEEASLVREDKDDDDEKVFGVKLSTVHASKGLEFEVVFIVACEEELFPHWKSMHSDAELQEERRLMYVAMTRAEKQLYISSADNRRNMPTTSSRFIYEIENF